MELTAKKEEHVTPEIERSVEEKVRMGVLGVWDRVRDRARRILGNHDTLREDEEGTSHTDEYGSVSESSTSNGGRNLNTDYTELMGGSVPCPSCKGSGRIPKEMEETLVALIPINDDRLKPKRTWMWVLMGIAICVAIASAAIFMLVPRSVELSPSRKSVDIVNVINSTTQPPTVKFYFINHVNISNQNYYAVQVVNTSAQVISKFQPWSTEVVGAGSNNTAVTIAPLSVGGPDRLFFNNTVTLTDIAAEYCQGPFSRFTSLYVTMQFDVAVTLSYFNHKEQITLSTTQQVCCVKNGNCTST